MDESNLIQRGFARKKLAANNRVFFSTRCTYSEVFKVLELPLDSAAQSECKTVICNLYNPLHLYVVVESFLAGFLTLPNRA
jgi:hypothetical protein